MTGIDHTVSFVCPIQPVVAIVPLSTVDMDDSRLGRVTWFKCPRCSEGSGWHLVVWAWLTTEPEYAALFQPQPLEAQP
jgi:hypothetical protein